MDWTQDAAHLLLWIIVVLQGLIQWSSFALAAEPVLPDVTVVCSIRLIEESPVQLQNVHIVDTTMNGNEGGFGSALTIHVHYGTYFRMGVLNISRSNLCKVKAKSSGGAIYLGINKALLHITQSSKLENNIAGAYGIGKGGAVYTRYSISSLVVDGGSSISNIVAGGFGGAFHVGGSSSSNVSILACSNISWNFANNAGGEFSITEHYLVQFLLSNNGRSVDNNMAAGHVIPTDPWGIFPVDYIIGGGALLHVHGPMDRLILQYNSSMSNNSAVISGVTYIQDDVVDGIYILEGSQIVNNVATDRDFKRRLFQLDHQGPEQYFGQCCPIRKWNK
ncbi:hypothetical protein Vretimale_14617 [Volvox reticuliferus]|uniref:Uncharacterized protein n=1 Tax=Volvox reticuliferus TaxID=1737510 RepID=A0A8J4FX07_9CHLO|nr:hypothetical protein Vretifemale_15716 [Volvox reticuliferus]GIM11107.1 hypothetical protein Vretimale_14617 [Volvox reticuliferus]